MIAITFDIEYTGLLAEPKRMRKAWNKIKINAYKHAGEVWHRKYARRHFTNPGAKKYGYKKRKGQEFAFGSKAFRGSYTGKKWRKHKHTNPLVFSGDTKRDVLTKWRVQGKRAGYAQVVMNARGLNRRPKGGRINMRQEMETVIKEEVDVMARATEKHANKAMQKLKTRKRRRKKIGA